MSLAPFNYSGLQRLRLDSTSRVLVVGLGITGLSVASFLAQRGVQLAVTDTRANPPGLQELRELLPDVAVFLGGFEPVAFARATHLVVSPGIALETPVIQEAIKSGLPVFGDLDLFAAEAQAPIIGITGSNGKSTVTSLLGLMAELDGCKVKVGGNLGTPMLDLLDAEAELYVLELSSFQLERSEIFEAKAATVLNISPDHLDRYADLQAYADAKKRIFRGNGLMVLNDDDPAVLEMVEPSRNSVRFSVKTQTTAEYRLEIRDGVEYLIGKDAAVMPASEVRIKGRHNLANALSTIALGDEVGISRAAMVRALREFPGLDHRMQWVAEVDGVSYINDSKATNIGACIAALEGLREPVVLIAGGDGKGADFELLRDAVQQRVRAAVLLGRDAGLLEAALSPVVQTLRVNNLQQAVPAARQLAQKGDVVLLAPACASLDQFKDYKERGRVFADAVRGLAA